MPEIQKPKIQEEQKMKVSLKEMPKKHKKSGDIKKKVKPSPIAPPMPKGSQLKKITKTPIKYEPNKPVKKTTLNKPKPTKPKPVTKPKPKVRPLAQKPFIELSSNKDINTTVKKEPEKEIKEPVDPLYAILSQDKSSEEETEEKTKTYSESNINNNIKELYGEDFGKLSAGQQKYIIDNQEIMRRITQQVLTRVARVNLPNDLNVNKTNIIEFYLHPNGDMTDFKFLKKSGYYVLDDTTKETIGYAYSRYPRPTEKTLVRYNVYYNLARR
ncbi:MAG: protein TonB [Sulfurimonas sp.]|jgi:protein TonB